MLNAYRLHITSLSPIHIGTGDSYEPTNYVIEDGVLHEFDTGAVIDTLSAKDHKDLLDIGSRKPNTEMIQAVRRFFYERREVLIAYAVQRIPVLPGVARYYAQRIGQPANREADGKTIINKLEIDRTGFNPVTHRPILFGTSLKGAIRTALLDQVNAGRAANERKGLHEFQGSLLKYYDKHQKPKTALEKDPLRLVHLADATWVGEKGLPATQVFLAVNRKKAPVKDEAGNLRASQAQSKDLSQLLECVPSFRYRSFAGQFNIQLVAQVGDRHANKLPVRNLCFEAAQIARACNDFYLPILQAEIRLLRGRGYLDERWAKSIELLLDASQAKREKGAAFLLRVGRHSGAESVTLNGVRKIKILLGKDPKTGDQKFTTMAESKTLWLAAQEKDQVNGLLPFGWLLVELEPWHAAPKDWPDLQRLCEPYLAEAQTLRNRLAALEARGADVRAAIEARRAEGVARAEAEAEAAARRVREEAERQARLAAMSENMKRVEAFKQEMQVRAEQLRGSKDRAHTVFHEKARALAKAAREESGWTVEERRAAAQAIEDWLPRVINVDMKDERKKLKLRDLIGKQ
jgi:CRISPR-associated protein Csm5